MALCRGAARTQNRDWGVMITWTYRAPPYMEPAEELYSDMVKAYLNDIRYIVIFNFPKITELGVLTREHLERWKNFGNLQKLSDEQNEVLGKYIGYFPRITVLGFCSPNGNLWILWDLTNTPQKYGTTLTICSVNMERSWM